MTKVQFADIRAGLTERLELTSGWQVMCIVDDDGHLNVYITNTDGSDIQPIETGQGDGQGEQLALRFTTQQIEADYLRQDTPPV